jgi:hypothetical protein
MPDWTNKEIALLKSFHGSGLSRAELAVKFPRHTMKAVGAAACKYGVQMMTTHYAHWARVVHSHFIRREQELKLELLHRELTGSSDNAQRHPADRCDHYADDGRDRAVGPG